MHRTQSRTDGRTDELAHGLYASLSSFAGIKTKCTCIPMKQNNSKKVMFIFSLHARLCHRCKIHTRCKIYRGGGDYVHVAKIQGGLCPPIQKWEGGLSGGGGGDFCPTLCWVNNIRAQLIPDAASTSICCCQGDVNSPLYIKWGSSLTGVIALCPWARHINPSLVLVPPRKTRPYLTERLLMGRKESNRTNKQTNKQTDKKYIKW